MSVQSLEGSINGLKHILSVISSRVDLAIFGGQAVFARKDQLEEIIN
jgi:hypothetical protein